MLDNGHRFTVQSVLMDTLDDCAAMFVTVMMILKCVIKRRAVVSLAV